MMITRVTLALTCFLLLPAHDWYDARCCSDEDCSLVSSDAVQFTLRGWLIVNSGEVIPFGDRRILVSPDGFFHLCQYKYVGLESTNIYTRCLYIPPPGS